MRKSAVKANLEAEKFRRKHGLSGWVDVIALAHKLGLEVYERAMPADELHEVIVKTNVAVSEELSEPEQRWAIAHGIGHHALHSTGNQVWLRANSGLADKLERQAEEFAYDLLVNLDEARDEGLRTAPEIAAYFGVPADFVEVQGRLMRV